MAHLLSVMMAASVVAGQDVRHVLAGQEYRYTDQAGAEGTREAKSAGLCSKIPADKYQNCHPQAEDSRSFHDYSSEDIERLTNVSFSSEQYTGRVLLVVNLASF